jgi:hypothetical protein
MLKFALVALVVHACVAMKFKAGQPKCELEYLALPTALAATYDSETPPDANIREAISAFYVQSYQAHNHFVDLKRDEKWNLEGNATQRKLAVDLVNRYLVARALERSIQFSRTTHPMRIMAELPLALSFGALLGAVGSPVAVLTGTVGPYFSTNTALGRIASRCARCLLSVVSVPIGAVAASTYVTLGPIFRTWLLGKLLPYATEVKRKMRCAIEHIYGRELVEALHPIKFSSHSFTNALRHTQKMKLDVTANAKRELFKVVVVFQAFGHGFEAMWFERIAKGLKPLPPIHPDALLRGEDLECDICSGTSACVVAHCGGGDEPNRICMDCLQKNVNAGRHNCPFCRSPYSEKPPISH